MEQARKRPKILLLRSSGASNTTGDPAASWTRLVKALHGFTDLEERELPALQENLGTVTQGFDFTFLDTQLASWSELKNLPDRPPLCLVQPTSFAWGDPLARLERSQALSHFPLLLLEELSAQDLVRVLHLFLMPKRLAGVTPLMEKGSLILGEKVMDSGGVGALLDRVGTFLERTEGVALASRVPDLRQVLSALLFEALRLSRDKTVHYPYVDFQLSPGNQKLAVNLRFPRGQASLEKLVTDALTGANLFWHQIWQCSDVLLLTHHKAQDEIEAMVLLYQPERNLGGRFRSLLFKTSESSRRRDDLLDPPGDYRFLLISEIATKETQSFEVLSAGDSSEDEFTEGVPEKTAQRIRQLSDHSRVLTDHLARKDQQIQELTKKNQQLAHEISSRRSDHLKADQQRDSQAEASERRIREMKSEISALRSAGDEDRASRDSVPAGALQEAIARLESALRAAENEKMQLKESVAHEQKRHASLEAKYSHVYKESSSKDRELLELRAALNKLRRESDRAARPTGEEKKEPSTIRVKELEERELTHKTDVKRLTYKIESMEKSQKVQQTEATERQKLYEQKLKQAKSREVDLLRRIEELTASLKKITNKAA